MVVGFQERSFHLLLETAQARSAPLLALQESGYQPLNWGRFGGEFMLREFSGELFRIKMLSGHQLDNAATAVIALFPELKEARVAYQRTAYHAQD